MLQLPLVPSTSGIGRFLEFKIFTGLSEKASWLIFAATWLTVATLSDMLIGCSQRWTSFPCIKFQISTDFCHVVPPPIACIKAIRKYVPYSSKENLQRQVSFLSWWMFWVSSDLNWRCLVDHLVAIGGFHHRFHMFQLSTGLPLPCSQGSPQPQIFQIYPGERIQYHPRIWEWLYLVWDGKFLRDYSLWCLLIWIEESSLHIEFWLDLAAWN